MTTTYGTLIIVNSNGEFSLTSNTKRVILNEDLSVTIEGFDGALYICAMPNAVKGNVSGFLAIATALRQDIQIVVK